MHWVPEIVHGMNSERTSKKWSSVWMVMTSRNSRLVATCRWNNGWIWVFTSEPNPWWFEKKHIAKVRSSGDTIRHEGRLIGLEMVFLTAGCPRQVSKRRDSPSIDVDKKNTGSQCIISWMNQVPCFRNKSKDSKDMHFGTGSRLLEMYTQFFLKSVFSGYRLWKDMSKEHWPLL